MKHFVETNLEHTLENNYQGLYEAYRDRMQAFARGAKGATAEAENAYVMEKHKLEVAELPEEVTVLPAYDINSYLHNGYTVLYASPDGAANADGSEGAPYALRDALRIAGETTGAVAVLLTDGIYIGPFQCNDAHSGTPEAPFILAKKAGADVKLTMAKELSPSLFAPVSDNDPMKARMHPEVKDKILSVDLRALGWKEEEIGCVTKKTSHALYCNNELCNIARFPSTENVHELLFFDEVIDTGSVLDASGSCLYTFWIARVAFYEAYDAFRNGKGAEPNWKRTYLFKGKETELYASKKEAIADYEKLKKTRNENNRIFTDRYTNSNMDHGFTVQVHPNFSNKAEKHISEEDLSWIASWKSISDHEVWFSGNAYEGWDYNRYVLESFEETDGKFILTTKTGGSFGAQQSGNSPTGHNNFYLFNAIEALRTPGEWYLDEKTAILYIYPAEDFASAKLEYAADLSATLTLTNIKNILIDGLYFEKTLSNAIFAKGGEGIVVQQCDIRYFKGNGINLTDVHHCAVIRNKLLYGQSAAIAMRCAAAISEGFPSLNVIQNNLIDQPLGANQGGITFTGYRDCISHNTLHYTQIGFDDAYETLIEYNDLWGGHTHTSDAGLIYTVRYRSRGNHIRYNYLHDWHAPGNGIYLDDLNMGNYVYGNIIDTTAGQNRRALGFIYTSTGHDHVFRNNFCIGRSVVQETKTSADGKVSIEIRSGIIRSSIGKKEADGRYPFFAEVDGKIYRVMTDMTDHGTSKVYFGTDTSVPGYAAVEAWSAKSMSDTDGDAVSLTFFYEDGSQIKLQNYADRINQSWLYFSAGCHLGYRFPHFSGAYYRECGPYICDPSKLYAKRFPETVDYMGYLGEYLANKDRPDYKINPLEIYIRSLTSIIVKDNIVLGVPDAYVESNPSAKAEGVDCNGDPVIYRGTHTDVEQNNLDIQTKGYDALLPYIEEYRKTGENFRELLLRVEAVQKQNVPEYIPLSFVLDKAGMTQA